MVELGDLIIEKANIENEEVRAYAFKLATDFNHINTTEKELIAHFENDIVEYYEVFKRDVGRIGNIYISARELSDQVFYTLDGYSEFGTFKDALKVGRWMTNKFISEHDDNFLFTAEERTNAGAMILVSRLGFKPIASNKHYIFYKYEE